MQVEFKFSPHDKIKIIAYSLEYPGRIMRCIKTANGIQYDVDYVVEGEIKTGVFLEDELA